MIQPRKDNKLRYVQSYTDQHGKRRHYYRRAGRKIAIKGEFGSSEWLKSYQEMHEGFSAATASRFAEDTFGHAVEAYLKSPKFERLKPQTKYAYRLEIDRLVKDIGKARLAAITRGMVVRMRDQVAETSQRRAIEVLKVLSLIFERACDLDLIERNPARRVDNPIGYKAKPHQPWSRTDIETFLAGAAPVWRRAFMILLHTGLRREDAVNLRREHIVNGRICLTKETTGETTRKTGAEVVIPITDALSEELSRSLSIEGLTLIVGTRGRPIRGDVLSHSIKKEAKRLGIEKPSPLHGLRKNAVMSLIEHGLDVQEIHAITGQSEPMIRHYGQEYDRHRLVDQAIVKLARKKPQNNT